ncbi:MAG: glycosyl hydrolase [Armatimonadota bacterium]
MLILASLLGAFLIPQNTDLSANFKNPPASARPHTWWHWMGGNVTKEGITADLEAMKQAGIGGAHIFDAGQGIPNGPIKYNSPEWRELMAFAFQEGKRLGLDMTMHNSSGWSSSGGPWVTKEDAMKKIVISKAIVQGGKKVKMPAPVINQGYYRDLQIVAVPTPDVPNQYRMNELAGLGANPGPRPHIAWPRVEVSDCVQIPLTATEYELPEGDWTILRFGVTLTGALNVASRPTGEGLEVDKLSADSLDRFFAGGLNPLFKTVGKDSSLHTVLIDSYETGYNNWTPKLFEEFKKRRGYDPMPYLPCLAGYSITGSDTTFGFLFDWRKTLSELWAENYSGHFANKLKQQGLQLAIEPYGNGNFDPFTYGKPGGLIMGEYWVGEGQINAAVKVAASVAHVYGKNVVGAEALTASPEQAGWRNQPRQWKAFADRGMTTGVNRIIYHRFAHQPWVSGVNPGMTMGPWGSHVDRTNTIWPYMATWDQYVSRCQYMLQSGTFAADILLFSGEDTPQNYAGEGQNLPEIPAGYDHDYIGLDPLMSLTVKNKKLVLPNGASYAVLALPSSDFMTVKLARKIKQLVQDGATIVGPRPIQTPSLQEVFNKGQVELGEIADELWGIFGVSPSVGKSTGKGQVIWGKTLGEVLGFSNLRQDFVSDAKDISFIHRKIGTTDTYFVASPQPYPRTVTCNFRISSANTKVQLWHPETGRIEDAPVWQKTAHGVSVPVNLDADGSVFVVFSPATAPAKHITETREIVAPETTKPAPTLTILKAIYGDAPTGRVKDVTSILARAVTANTIRIVASNSDLGGDPVPQVVKTLTITYKLGEETKSVTLPENAMFTIGDFPNAGTPPISELQGNTLKVWKNGTFSQTWSTGQKTQHQVKDLPQPIELTGPWQIKFTSTYDPEKTVTYDKLKSWTDDENFDNKYFSGTGTYSKSIQVNKSLLGKGKRLFLDLGDVRELCRVRLNGKPVATLWKSPFRVDITDFAKPGANTLEVDVTNLWTNRLIGDEQFPDDMGWDGAVLKDWPQWFLNHQPRPEPRRKTFTTWRHNFKDTQLLPSGLLGPVMLRPVKEISLPR